MGDRRAVRGDVLCDALRRIGWQCKIGLIMEYDMIMRLLAVDVRSLFICKGKRFFSI